MWWFILKLLGLLIFFSILLVADDKLGDFIIFGINTDLFDLRLGGVGPYSMVIIAMVRVSLTYSNERSYIALKVEQREKNEGETEEEEDQEIEQDLEEEEKEKKPGKKKKKKRKRMLQLFFPNFQRTSKILHVYIFTNAFYIQLGHAYCSVFDCCCQCNVSFNGLCFNQRRYI